MKPIAEAVIWALAVLLFALMMAYAMIDTQKQHEQLHNPYWPFTVETVVHDR